MKVLVLSDHNLIGESLVTLLQNLPSHEPVEPMFYTTPQAAAQFHTVRPDVVLIEATMDFANAAALVRTLRRTSNGSRIVVMGKCDDETSIYEAISAGAEGYIAADAAANVLLATLEGVVRGELGLSRAAALRVVQQLRNAAHPDPGEVPADLQERLTRREREVFHLVRSGLRSREIAHQLSIAEATVYKHIQNILEKLQVRSRAQAVFLAESESAPVVSGLGARRPESASSAS